MRAIVTVPPHATFLPEVAAHPMTAGLRLNTVMPIAEPHTAVLRRLRALGRPLWVDLKGRQLRVSRAALPPFTEVQLSHRVQVRTPCDAFFSDGREHARVLAVDGDRLILEESPRRVVGPGESVNIVAEDLRIEGGLTDGDRHWLAAMAELGERDVMLSFVEGPEDLEEVRSLLPEARIVQKIESRKGLAWVGRGGAKEGRLMAARGDLYVEVVQPHRILGAMRRIVQADPTAIAASRVLTSLAFQAVPDCADLSDVAWLHAIGYRSLMLGDEVCQRREAVLAALNALQAIADELE